MLSVWFTPFEKHTTNGTYGGALGAMHQGDIDYILSGLFFTLSRFPYISPVMTLAKFRYAYACIIFYIYTYSTDNTLDSVYEQCFFVFSYTTNH